MNLTKSQNYEIQVVEKDNGYLYLRVVENGVGLSPLWFSLYFGVPSGLSELANEEFESHYQNSLKEY